MSARVWGPGRSVSRPAQRSAPAPRSETASKSGRTGGDTGPPLHGHRSAQQPQAGRGRARPLREHRECRSAGRCRHRPLRKDRGYSAASPLGITAVRPPARSEAPVPVPPPQRPFRRQCRSAASRTAGTLNRSRHPTGDPRPSPPARSEAPAPVPGKVQEGAESPFLVSASGGKKQDHFSRRHVRREKFLSRSDVQRRPRPNGAGPPLHPSAVQGPLRRCRRGPWPSCRPRAARGRGSLKGGRQSPLSAL